MSMKHRKWGKLGGQMRAKKLNPKRRASIARRAAFLRWEKAKEVEKELVQELLGKQAKGEAPWQQTG
jgi:hypothetical protein